MVKLAFLIFLVLPVGCLQTYNSNSNDENLFKQVTIADPVFAEAYKVLSVRCMNCHDSSRHSHWAGYVNSSDWLRSDNGEVLVVSRDIAASGIIKRLTGWGSVGGMPEGASNLTQQEYTALKDWIESM